MDQPTRYRIQVQGQFGEQWLATIAPSTVTAAVLDQAALQGLLRTLYSLGLPLLLVRWEPTDEKGEGQ